MPFTPLPGVNCAVAIGATKYAFDSIKFGPKNTLPKVTNFTSSGFGSYVAGVTEGKITVGGPWDGGNMSSFVVGASVTLVLSFSGTINVSCPCIIESIDVDAKVEDAVRVSVTLQTSGVFVAALS